MYRLEGEGFVKVFIVRGRGTFAVDLRKHTAHNSELVSSGIGVQIPWSVWEKIVQAWERVETSVGKEEKMALDFLPESGVHLTVKKFKEKMYIDLREHFLCEGDGHKPTRRGVTLTRAGAEKLKETFDKLAKDKDALEIFG